MTDKLRERIEMLEYQLHVLGRPELIWPSQYSSDYPSRGAQKLFALGRRWGLTNVCRECAVSLKSASSWVHGKTHPNGRALVKLQEVSTKLGSPILVADWGTPPEKGNIFPD